MDRAQIIEDLKEWLNVNRKLVGELVKVEHVLNKIEQLEEEYE